MRPLVGEYRVSRLAGPGRGRNRDDGAPAAGRRDMLLGIPGAFLFCERDRGGATVQADVGVGSDFSILSWATSSRDPLPPLIAKPRSNRSAASWLRIFAVGEPSTTTSRWRP